MAKICLGGISMVSPEIKKDDYVLNIASFSNHDKFLRIAELCYFLSGRSETVHGVADEGLIKVGARVSYHARRWYVHVASAFPLAQHFRAVLDWGP